jgi:citrate lyase subunit beta/citryl-CoA lyase
MREHRPRRGVLIAPGSDGRKAHNALSSSADEVVLDLEDAVAPACKKQARDLVCDLTSRIERAGGVSVRINPLGTPWFSDDLAACASITELTSVVLPKAETPHDLQVVAETPRGLQNIDLITAATDRLASVIIGYADLGALLGRSPSTPPEYWLTVQDRVLIAARAAGILAVDGPHLGIRNDDDFRRSCRWTSALGFDGKWVIHPDQVPTVLSLFSPSDEEVEHARRFLGALSEAHQQGSGTAQMDGRMLDEAVAVSARRVLARAGAR